MSKCTITITNSEGTFDFEINESLFDCLAGGEPLTDEDKVSIVVTKFEENTEHEVAIEGTYL